MATMTLTNDEPDSMPIVDEQPFATVALAWAGFGSMLSVLLGIGDPYTDPQRVPTVTVSPKSIETGKWWEFEVQVQDPRGQVETYTLLITADDAPAKTDATGVKPTAAQVELIRYFAGGRPTGRSPKQSTYEACRRNGWIVPIAAFPFHQTTAAGLAVIGQSH